MTEYRFDAVITSPENSHLRVHHCKGWDIDSETGDWRGCYGTNLEHGETFEEAKKELVEYLELQYDFEYDDREGWGFDDDFAGEIKKNLDYYQGLTYNEWLENNINEENNV